MASISIYSRLGRQLTRSPTFPSSCAAPLSTPLRRHYSSHYDRLLTDLPARRLPLIYDDLVPGPSHRLNISLSAFLPTSWSSTQLTDNLPDPPLDLPPAHHLVYFNPVLPANRLLPDGTDPRQSPGGPFVRRMWAGGALRFNPDSGPVEIDGQRWVCLEGIRDVSIKGPEGQEKVFVGIERRVGRVPVREKAKREELSEDKIRERLWTEREGEFGDALLVERRNIVFMRERTPAELEALADASKAKIPAKILKPQYTPTFSHTLTPTPSLLFRYSALTFNAHAIHLDPAYCRDVEGHRERLVHGPMAFTLLVTMLHNHIKASKRELRSIEYRNVAPLYCNEPLKLCGREVEDGKFEIWAETPEGGVAVKGVARVESPAPTTSGIGGRGEPGPSADVQIAYVVYRIVLIVAAAIYLTSASGSQHKETSSLSAAERSYHKYMGPDAERLDPKARREKTCQYHKAMHCAAVLWAQQQTQRADQQQGASPCKPPGYWDLDSSTWIKPESDITMFTSEEEVHAVIWGHWTMPALLAEYLAAAVWVYPFAVLVQSLLGGGPGL